MIPSASYFECALVSTILFFFFCGRLLLWVRDKTGVIPNIPTRACEYVLGRIRCVSFHFISFPLMDCMTIKTVLLTRGCQLRSLVDLIVIQPIHMVSIVSTSVFLRRVLPDNIVSMALEPIEYSDSENPWIVVSLVLRRFPRVLVWYIPFHSPHFFLLKFRYTSFRIYVERYWLLPHLRLQCWSCQFYFN
jgi:hypothetical protein